MDAMDAMDAVALGARVQQVADKLLHKAQEARARGNAAAAQSLSESVTDLRHAAAVLVEQKRLLTVRQAQQSSAAVEAPPPSSSSGLQESSGDAAPRARLRRNSSASSVMSMLSTYEVGSVYNGSVAGSVHHSHSHAPVQSQQQQELVARLTRVEKMLGKKSDEMKAKGNENAAHALLQSASYVRNGGSFIAEQQHTISALAAQQERLQIQWRALGKLLARHEQDERGCGDDDDVDENVLSKVAATATELAALRDFLKTAFPTCRDPSDVGELAAALQRERDAAKQESAAAFDEAVKALEAERDHLHSQLAEAKRVHAEEYLIAREDIEILKSENELLERKLRAAETEAAVRSERELLEHQMAFDAVAKSNEELKQVLEAQKQQLSELSMQVESWRTQFHDEQRSRKESLLTATDKHSTEVASMDAQLTARDATIAALEEALKLKNEDAGVASEMSAVVSEEQATPSAVSSSVDHAEDGEKPVEDAHTELRALLRECEEALESERAQVLRLKQERDALDARMSEIEQLHDSEIDSLKNEHDSRVADVEEQHRIAHEELQELLDKLSKLTAESESRERINCELKDAMDGYREECFKVRKELDERDAEISRLQETLQSKDDSVDDARRQIKTQLSALRSDAQALCACMNPSADASPDAVVRHLIGLVLQSESRKLQDALVVQMKSYAALSEQHAELQASQQTLKEQRDNVQEGEQKLRDMAVAFLVACESCAAHEADTAVGGDDLGERFERVQTRYAKALDEIRALKQSVGEKAEAERTLERKLEEIVELQQKCSDATDAVHQVEQQLKSVQSEKAKLESELHEHRSKSIDGAGREEARAREVGDLEQRLKDVESEFERYRSRSHTALKKVEKRAELLNGMRKENEQLKKKVEDAELECQRVAESEKQLGESLQEATQTQRMMREEFEQRVQEAEEKAVASEAQLLQHAEELQLAQRELQEAKELLKKLEQKRAAKDAELVELTLKCRAKEDEAAALSEEILKLKRQGETHAAELAESASTAEDLQAKLQQFEHTVAQLESELAAVRRRAAETSASDAAAESEIVETLREELARLQAALAGEKAASETKCAELALQVKQLELEAKASKDTIHRLSQEIKEKAIVSTAAAAAAAEDTSTRAQAASAAHDSEDTVRLQEEKRKLESKHQAQEARIAKLVSQSTGYEHRIEFLEEQIEALQNRLEEVSDPASSKSASQQSAANAPDATKDEVIRELRRQVLDLQEQLEHFDDERVARELEKERGELVEIQAARLELQKKNEHAITLKQRKAVVTSFKQQLHTVVDELQRGLDEHSTAFRDACEFRDAHSRKEAVEDEASLPAEGASTEDSAPIAESSLLNDKRTTAPVAATADEFEEYLVMNSGVVIKAGASFQLPVFCEKKGWRVVWTFSVKEESADVGFALSAADSSKRSENGDHQRLIVVPQRVNTLSGVYSVDDDSGTTLVFEWDNTFSWLNEKTLDYHVSVQEPLSAEKQQIKVQEQTLLSSSKQLRAGLAILAAEADSRAQLKSAVEHLRASEQEKDAYVEQFSVRKGDILAQKTALQQQMEELKTALSNMLSEQDEIEDGTRTLLKAWDGAEAEREDAETTIRLAETSQFELLAAQLETQVQTLEQALLGFQDGRSPVAAS